MKQRLLGSALALAVVWSAQPAQAELLKNFRLGGQLDVQATAASNITDFQTRANNAPAAANTRNDRIGDAQTRLLLHADWDLLDDVHARVTLRKNDRNYGTVGGNGNPNANSQPITGGGANSVLDKTFVDEAYAKIDKIAGQIDLTLGRQFYGTSGDLVIYYGPSDKAQYGLPVQSIDVARADWGNEWVGVTGVAGKLTGTALGVAALNRDLRGLNIALKGDENWTAALYGWNAVTHNVNALGAPPTSASTGGLNDNLFVVGLKFKLSGGGFWLRSEFDQNFGENRQQGTANVADSAHYNGWATLTNAGWKMEAEDAGMFGVWGEYGLGSGRQNSRENVNDGFVAINSDYRPGSIYGRFASTPVLAVFGANLPAAATNAGVGSTPGLSNRQIWGGGLRWSPAAANKLTAAVSYWDYRIHRFTKSPAQLNDPLNGNRHIGSEVDVDLVWTHSENVAFAAGWGEFMPGGAIYEANRAASANGGIGVNPAFLWYFDTRVRF